MLGGAGKGFCDLLDLVIMQAFKWRLKNGNCGMSFTSVSRAELMTSMYNTWEVAMEAREQLIEVVTDFDTELPEQVIETEFFGDVSESALKSAGLISGLDCPGLCGVGPLG